MYEKSTVVYDEVGIFAYIVKSATATSMPNQTVKPKIGIQPVVVGLRLLEALAAAGGGATLNELADSAGVYSEKARRHLPGSQTVAGLGPRTLTMRKRWGSRSVPMGPRCVTRARQQPARLTVSENNVGGWSTPIYRAPGSRTSGTPEVSGQGYDNRRKYSSDYVAVYRTNRCRSSASTLEGGSLPGRSQ